MPKQPTPKQDAATKLLDINGKLHEVMATLEVEKVVDEGIAVIPVAPIYDAEEYAKTAYEVAQNVGVSGELLNDTFQLQQVLLKVIEKYGVEQDKLTLPAEVASDLSMVIINFLANKIHDMAMQLIGATGQIQACSATKIDPEEAATVAKYCSGVLPNISKATVAKVSLTHKVFNDQKVVQHYPTNIIHTLGLHKVEVSTHTAEKNPLVAIEYHDSSASYADSKTRLKGVTERLKKEGLLCFPQYPNLYCSGEFSKDKLTQLATFFSLLLNADVAHMGLDTIPVISDATWDLAGSLVIKHGDDTWKSGQGQVDWGSLRSKWKQDKEIMAKSKIYGDLKQLAIHRDRHHELEEALGVDMHIHAGKKAVTDISGNAEKAVALCKKNSWGSHYLNNLQANIEQFKASGSGSTSDAIGNIIHNILIDALQGLGEYGNCPTGIQLPDVNAGALSYCEGTLKGTTTILEGGGSQPLHKVAPKQYKSVIIDENPNGGYDVHIPIDTGFWSKELADYLKDKFGFDCKSEGYGKWKAGQVCNVHIDSHDKIRLLAIFLSNLKGGSEAIGEECVPIAMQEAWNYAQEQAKKGTMSFTQEPIVESQKQWIDKCYKTYGIMPPGLTNEQKELLKIIGPSKIYAGCDLSAEETVPNMGIITYCEGVRTNPQAVVSAILTPQGYLAHFFHDKTDKLADVFVNPLEAGKYEVEIKNIDMREANLTNEVIKRLKTMNYNCHGNVCEKEIGEEDIRWLAMFLSSLHQAYKLQPTQIPAAVDLAINKINASPNDKNSFKNMVYPYTVEDWNKVLGKAPAAPTIVKPIKGVIQPPMPAGKVYPKLDWAYVTSLPNKGKPPWNVGGCISFVSASPTKIKKGYCAGVLREAIDSKGNEIDLLKIAKLMSKESTHPIIGNGDIIFDSKFNTLYITLPDELAKIEPLKIALEKNLLFKHVGETTWQKDASVLAASRVGYFFSQLHNITELPESCWGDAVLHALEQLGTLATLKPVYPFTKEDWMKDVCKIEAPTIITAAILKDAVLKEYQTAPAQTLKYGDLVEKIQSKMAVNSGPADKEGTIAWANDQLLKEGKIAFVGGITYILKIEAMAEEPPPPIDELLEKTTAAMQHAYTLITPELKKKAEETKAYKNLPQKVKDWMHLAINSHLLSAYKHKKPLEDTLSGLNYLFLELNKFPITPLMVKKQTELEKKAKIRKGELPAEPGEKVEKTLEHDSSAELKTEVMNELKDLYDSGTIDIYQLVIEIKEKFGLITSPYLNTFITGWVTGYQSEIDKSNEPVSYLELPKDMKSLLHQSISEKAAEGKDFYTIIQEIAEQFNVYKTSIWQEKAKKEVAAYQSLMAKKKVLKKYEELPSFNQEDIKDTLKMKLEAGATGATAKTEAAALHGLEFSEGLNQAMMEVAYEITGKEMPSHPWEDWTPDGKEEVILEAYQWAKDNPEYDCIQIITLLESKYGLKLTPAIKNVAEQVVESAKALKEGLIDKEKYTKPWVTPTGWEEVPLEIAACMGKVLNTIMPGTTHTGLYIPVINLHAEGFMDSQIEEYWGECVEKYEHEKSVKEEPKHKPTEGELTQWAQSYLVSHPGDKHTAQELANVSTWHTDWDTDIVHVGDTLVKLAEAGQLHSEQPDKQGPIYFWYGEELVGVPTIAEFMDAEPASAEEAEALSVHLMEQNKYSINEISKAVAGKYAIKNDTYLQKWLKKVKDHHELKVQLGPKFEELDTEGKTDIINYIVEQSEYPEDEILSFVYGTHGVMNSPALELEIGKVKSHVEELLSKEAGMAEKEGEVGFSDISDDLKAEMKVKVQQQLAYGVTSTAELASILYHTFLVSDEDGNMYDWIDAIKAEKTDMKVWADLPPEKKQEIINFVALKSNLTESQIYPLIHQAYGVDANTLPSLALLYEASKKKEEEEELHEIGEESGDAKHEILLWAESHAEGSLDNWVRQVASEFELVPDEALEEFLKPAWLEEQGHKDFWSITEENEAAIVGFKKIIQNMWKEGNSEFQIRNHLHVTYHLLKDDALKLFVNNVLVEIGVTVIEEPEKVEFAGITLDKAFVDPILADIKAKWGKDFGLMEAAHYVHDNFLMGVPVDTISHWLADNISSIIEETEEEKAEKEIQIELVDIKDIPISANLSSINSKIIELFKELNTVDVISNLVSTQYNLVLNKNLEQHVEGVLAGLGLQAAEEKAPSPEQMETYDEMIKAYYQMGWTPAAVIEFFAGKIPADQLKKTANKLYKVYKPEVVRITQEYDKISAPLKNHLSGLASKLLNEGKSIADVAWYISTNYGIEKESVKAMVRKVAEKPLEQVEAAVKAMQLLGVGEFIGGCRITEPMSELKPQNVAYCQGILEKKGELENSGASILHAMGHQEIEVFNKQQNGLWQTIVKLATDGGDNNKEKMQGVSDILGDILTCTYPGGDVLSCGLSGEDGQKLPIADQDKLRKTALFLSSIDNVAQLDTQCIPYALKYAMESAKKKNETSKPWSINVYPKEVEDWNTIVCSKILA